MRLYPEGRMGVERYELFFKNQERRTIQESKKATPSKHLPFHNRRKPASSKDREVHTPPRKKVNQAPDEMPNGRYKRFRRSGAWKAVPGLEVMETNATKRMRIRGEDVVSAIRLRMPLGLLANSSKATVQPWPGAPVPMDLFDPRPENDWCFLGLGGPRTKIGGSRHGSEIVRAWREFPTMPHSCRILGSDQAWDRPSGLFSAERCCSKCL